MFVIFRQRDRGTVSCRRSGASRTSFHLTILSISWWRPQSPKRPNDCFMFLDHGTLTYPFIRRVSHISHSHNLFSLSSVITWTAFLFWNAKIWSFHLNTGSGGKKWEGCSCTTGGAVRFQDRISRTLFFCNSATYGIGWYSGGCSFRTTFLEPWWFNS